jgi:hypothetical protein
MQTRLQKQITAWIAKHPFTPGMLIEKALRLNGELFRRFPLTLEEIEQRPKPVDVEFVL